VRAHAQIGALGKDAMQPGAHQGIGVKNVNGGWNGRHGGFLM
jgi:hypothetical protein